MKHTYQQTVTVVQLSDDCVNDIATEIGKMDTPKGLISATYHDITRTKHNMIQIQRNGVVTCYHLDGRYLAITDNHCWVMTPEELDAQDVKEC